jgi:hypothetical protein
VGPLHSHLLGLGGKEEIEFWSQIIAMPLSLFSATYLRTVHISGVICNLIKLSVVKPNYNTYWSLLKIPCSVLGACYRFV